MVPNPNNGKAVVFYHLGKENTSGEILITNLFGEIISRYPVNASSDKAEIDCEKFANGIYFTSLLVEGKLKSCKKMMIAK